MKVMITKDNNKEAYDLQPNMNYPLQFGNGDYTISILEHVKGNQYSPKRVHAMIMQCYLHQC